MVVVVTVKIAPIVHIQSKLYKVRSGRQVYAFITLRFCEFSGSVRASGMLLKVYSYSSTDVVGFFSWFTLYPTDPFTLLVLRNQSIDVSKVVRPSPDFETSNCERVGRGRAETPSFLRQEKKTDSTFYIFKSLSSVE